MGKSSQTNYAFMTLVVLILLFKSHSVSVPAVFQPSNKYINVLAVRLDTGSWIGALPPFVYTYTFTTAKANNNYKAGVIVAQIAYTFSTNRILSYEVLMGPKSTSAVKVNSYSLRPQAFTLLTIYLIVLQLQNTNSDFSYYRIDTQGARLLSPGQEIVKRFDAQVPVNSNVFISIAGVLAIPLDINYQVGLTAKFKQISTSTIEISALSTISQISFYSVAVVIFHYQNSLLLSAFPPTRITYNILSGSTSNNINLKASDPQNIIRNQNTIVGIASIGTRNNIFGYLSAVKPSTFVIIQSPSLYYIYQAIYLIFQTKQCPPSTPYLLVQTNLCYDACPQRYVLASALPKCNACPFDCSFCTIDGSCTSCNTVNDFRMMNKTTKRCVPLPGYYESNIATAGSCMKDCLKCTSTSDCMECAKDLMFRDGQCVTNCTSLGITVGKKYVEIMKECFDCGSIKQQSNGTALNATTCNCNESFIFNSTNKTCICPLSNSVVIEGKCFACGSIPQYSNGTAFNQSTCNCNESFVFNPTNKTCYCSSPNSVVIGGKCFHCANIPLYSNGTVLNASTCNCNETFVFNQTNKTCICPLSNSVVIEGKCFPCGNILQYSNRTVFNQSTCNCNQTFVFNSAAKTCDCLLPNSVVIGGKCFPCTDIPLYSNGTAFNTSTCNCNATFVFDPTNKTCICPQPNSNVFFGQCFACALGLVCRCAPTFLFVQSTQTCVCPRNSVLSANVCFNCSSIRYANSTGLVDPKNGSLCECYRSFAFNPQTRVCECPDSLSYVSVLRECVSCQGIGNGTDEVNGAACKCLQSYVYDARLNTCLCPPASIVLNNLCFSCRILNRKNGSGLVSPTNPNQCQCVPTFAFNSQAKQCLCPNDANSFVSKKNKCVSCLGIENGNGQADFGSKACKCSETFVYSAAQNKCLCPPGSIVLDNGQCFSCQALKNKNSNGLMSTATRNTCQCFSTFLFNSANKACECPEGQFVSKGGKCFSCAGAEGTAEFNQTSKECICNETYIYSSSLNKCICPPTSAVINSQCFVCSTLKGKNGTGEISKVSLSVCQCLKSFVFTEAKTCECPNAANSFVSKGGLCVSCLGIANGLNDEADLTSKKCMCKQSFVYHQGTNQCRCPLSSVIIGGFCFQCSTLKNKNSKGAVSNTDPSSCSCLTSFVFDPASKTCLCPNEANSFVSSAGRCVSCIGIQNGQNDQANIAAKTCVCKKSLVYVASANKCECPPSSIVINGECFSCSTLTNKNSTGGVNTTTGNTCRCLRSYVFNPNTKACECPDEANSYITPTKQCVSCLKIQNGTGAATKNGCECKDNTFVFYPSLMKCLCPPKYIFNGGSCVLSAQSQTIKEVTCPQNLHWDIFLQSCVCKVGFVLKGNLCIECKSIANAKGESSDKISCICAEGYTWDSTEYSCK